MLPILPLASQSRTPEMASLRRSRTLPTDGAIAKFLYTILKQLDLKSIDWQLVADQLDITNGHAARMRFSRFKQQMEGIPTQTRRPRPAASASLGGPRQKKVKPNKPSAQPAATGERWAETAVKGEVKVEKELSGMEMLIKAEAQEAGEAMEGVETQIKTERGIKPEEGSGERVAFIKPEISVKEEPRCGEEQRWHSANGNDERDAEGAALEIASLPEESKAMNDWPSTSGSVSAFKAATPTFTISPTTWAKFDAGFATEPESSPAVAKEEPVMTPPSAESAGGSVVEEESGVAPEPAVKPEPVNESEPIVKMESVNESEPVVKMEPDA